MAGFFSNLRRFLIRPKTPSRHERSLDTNFSTFQEGDIVLIHGRHPILTKALERNKSTGVSRGVIDHNDIIGKRPRDFVQARKGAHHRITFPTLEEYSTMSPRLVTPVYPADANLIVSLLDIHAPVPSKHSALNEPFEILEAGTGQGSLTLNLCRAINGANSCPPPLPLRSRRKIATDCLNKDTSDTEGPTLDESSASQEAWEAWKAERRAVVHTVEVSANHSFHAEKTVRGFRRGMYAGNAEFYVASVEEWIADQTQRRSKGLLSAKTAPFLSHAILDMPSAHLRIPHVSPVLKAGGALAVFMPNVTQIGDCVKIIEEKRLPLVLEKAVELGTGISSGRLWDIRMAVRKSASPKISDSNEGVEKEKHDVPSKDEAETKAQNGPNITLDESQAANAVLVCRPKVGERIVGGGFVGLWRKIKSE